MVQSLRVLEGAASVALLFNPKDAKKYLVKLGLNPQDIEREMAVEPIVNVHHLKRMKEKLDAQRRHFKTSRD